MLPEITKQQHFRSQVNIYERRQIVPNDLCGLGGLGDPENDIERQSRRVESLNTLSAAPIPTRQPEVPIARRVAPVSMASAARHIQAPRVERPGKCADILDNIRILKEPMKYGALALVSLFIAILVRNIGNPQSVVQTVIVLAAETIASVSIVASIALFAVKFFQPETQVPAILTRYGGNVDLLSCSVQRRKASKITLG